MPLRFPDLSIFIAAVHTDAAAINMVTRIEIAGTEYEVQVLIGTSGYAMALQAFYSSSQQERDQAIRHAEIILAIARADSLLADQSPATQGDTNSHSNDDSNTTKQSEQDKLKKYIEQTQRTQAEQQARKQQALTLLEQGCSVEEVAQQAGVVSSTIRRWRSTFKKSGRHIPYAHERRLTHSESQQLRKICQSKTPRAYGFLFDHWTPELVCKVAHNLLHKTLSQAAANTLLTELSSTPTPTSSTTEPTAQPSTSTAAQPSRPPRRHDRAYSAHTRTTAITEITVKKKPVLTVAAELGIAASTIFRWLKQEGHALPGRAELLTPNQLHLVESLLKQHTPSIYRIDTDQWNTPSIIILIEKIFYKTLTAERVEELFPEFCSPTTTTQSAAEESIVIPSEEEQQAQAAGSPTELPATDSSQWLPNDDLSAWCIEDIEISTEQTALDQQLLQQLLSEGVQGSLVPAEEVSPPHQSASPSYSPPILPDQWLPDDQLTDWLLQQGSGSSTTLPATSLEAVAPIPPAATGLRQQEVEELRVALSTRAPRHYGIDASDWTLEVIQRLIRQLLEREFTLGQVLDLLIEQGIPFHRVS